MYIYRFPQHYQEAWPWDVYCNMAHLAHLRRDNFLGQRPKDAARRKERGCGRHAGRCHNECRALKQHDI